MSRHHQHFSFFQKFRFLFNRWPIGSPFSLRGVSAGVREKEVLCVCAASGGACRCDAGKALRRRASITLRTISSNVSSTLTFSLALVSMKPQPLLLAHSNPSRLVTILASFKSHLFPAINLIGGTAPRSSLVSASIFIMSKKMGSCEYKESGCVISYTRRKASDLRFEEAHRPRYSSWPAVSVRERK